MAAVELELFNDVTNRKLVSGLTNKSVFVLPAFFHQDKISVLITFLKVNASGNVTSSPYSKVDISGATFAIKIYKKANASIVLASQTVWTANNDAKTLSAAIDLNTAAMATELPDSPLTTTELDAIIEFELGDGSGKITTYQETIKIKREYNISGSPAAVPGVTYYTADEINALFIKKIADAGDTLTLKSPNGAKQRIIGVRNDGEGQDDII